MTRWRYTFARMLALFGLGSAAASSKLDHPQKGPLFMAMPDDALADAARSAQVSLHLFRTVVAESVSVDAPPIIKARFINDDGNKIWLWLSVEQTTPDGFVAYVFEAPPAFSDLRPGSHHNIANSEVADWVYIQSGVMYGGYSLRLQRSRLPAAERESYDRYIGASSYAATTHPLTIHSSRRRFAARLTSGVRFAMKDSHDSFDLVVQLDEIIKKAEASGKDPGILRTTRDLIRMCWDFEDDLQEARKLFETSNADFAARTFLRTLASEFEAHLHFLSEFLVHLDSDQERLSAEEIFILKETSISLGRNGRITSSRRFYPFLDRLRFVLGCYERIYKVEIFYDKSDPRWNSVKRFIEIRNRITHPRSADDLWINPEDYDHLNHAQDWIRKALKSALLPLPKRP